jgi:hypothetical protein
MTDLRTPAQRQRQCRSQRDVMFESIHIPSIGGEVQGICWCLRSAISSDCKVVVHGIIGPVVVPARGLGHRRAPKHLCHAIEGVGGWNKDPISGRGETTVVVKNLRDLKHVDWSLTGGRLVIKSASSRSNPSRLFHLPPGNNGREKVKGNFMPRNSVVSSSRSTFSSRKL